MKSFQLVNERIRYLSGEPWSDRHGANSRNQAMLFINKESISKIAAAGPFPADGAEGIKESGNKPVYQRKFSRHRSWVLLNNN
ncbi:hypothetical protein [Nitrosomonas sp.]|uniref:hypothetical protein n=1 Tax=Nitrosomonas sp. TaxID=42353 RepID=UPI001D9BA1C9|nr:hypothetical protein [Nitrosomonas sp.]MBX3617102.1 hypothetical protein [Nitrosomonas sp.]